ncbi:MAG: redoxin domain-containing protein [Oscillospiraceae bacterium]
MNHFQKGLSLLLVLTLMLSAFSACGKKAAPAATEAAPMETVAATEAAAETEAPAQQTASDGHYHVGDKIEDFTITTYDGKEVNLYKVLEEKDMVLLNFWATYCGPCAQEFPAMQEAYEQYQDKVEIIALSGFEPDTDEALAAYVQKKGMTFTVGRDTIGLNQRMHVSALPTSVVIDRFGVICAISSASEPEASAFVNLFELYTAEDYTESVFIPKFSVQLPDVEPADPAQLNAALNGEGGNLVFTDSADRFCWPMIVEEKDGRTVAAASNANVSQSVGALETQMEAKAGDVLTVEYKFNNENPLCLMRMTVDGEDVMVSNLSGDWSTFIYPFKESGTHQVSFRFEKSTGEDAGEGLWIDSICLVTGDAAAEVLAKKPQYPIGEELRVTVVNETAKPAAFVEEDTGVFMDPATICDEPVLLIEVELPEKAVPETAYLMDVMTLTEYPLTAFVSGDRYLVEIPNSAISEAGISLIYMFCNGGQRYGGFTFASLDAADAAAQFMGAANNAAWRAVWPEDVRATAEEPAGDGTYTVTYVDQNGDPVPGVMCQVCDATTCQVFASDASGVCEFTLPVGAYEIHTLKVPAGYEGDTTTITEAPVGGGELNFTLTKN